MEKKNSTEKIEDLVKNDQLVKYLKQKENKTFDDILITKEEMAKQSLKKIKIKCDHCQNEDFNLELSRNLILIRCSSCKNIIGDMFSFHYYAAHGKRTELEIYEQELEFEKAKNQNRSNLFFAEYYSLKCALKPTLKINFEHQEIKNGFDFEDFLIKKLGWIRLEEDQNNPDVIDPEGKRYFLVRDPKTQKMKLQQEKEK